MTKDIENVYHLFRKVTSRSICHDVSCEGCHEIYNSDSCPMDESVTENDIFVFVNRVVRLLAEHKNMYGPNISEEELINIFMESEDGQN